MGIGATRVDVDNVTSYSGAVDSAGTVLTYRGRRGRLSALTRSRVDVVLPLYAVPEGPVNAEHVFGRRAPLVLEIGCGHGAAAIGFCVAHPDHDLVAVDVHLPDLARAAAAAADAAVRNLRLHSGDAVPLLERLPSGSLAAVHLFFPDPWPKAKHEKRRFVAADRLSLLLDRLRPDGALLVATDAPDYAGYLRRQASVVGARVVLSPRPAWRPLAGFELRAVEAGRRCIDLTVSRCG